MPKSVKEVLVTTRSLIAHDRNWGRTDLYKNGQFCLLGALADALGHPVKEADTSEKQNDIYRLVEHDPAVVFLASVIDKAEPPRRGNIPAYVRVYEFNDNMFHNVMHHAILSTLDQAIKEAA